MAKVKVTLNLSTDEHDWGYPVSAKKAWATFTPGSISEPPESDQEACKTNCNTETCKDQCKFEFTALPNSGDKLDKDITFGDTSKIFEFVSVENHVNYKNEGYVNVFIEWGQKYYRIGDEKKL